MYSASSDIYTLSLHDALPIFAIEVGYRFERMLVERRRSCQGRALVELSGCWLWNRRDASSSFQSGSFALTQLDRKSTRLNSSHTVISYAVFCLKKKNVKVLVESQLLGMPGGLQAALEPAVLLALYALVMTMAMRGDRPAARRCSRAGRAVGLAC